MTTNTMRIDSPRFGTLEISPERVIEFPAGLPGFEDARRFSLFHPEGGEPRYFILQSLDFPDLAFTVADPGTLGFTYEIELSDEETAAIAMTDASQVAVVVMLLKDEAAGTGVRANLNAPLVINLETRKGLQHLFSRLDYQVTLRAPAR